MNVKTCEGVYKVRRMLRIGSKKDKEREILLGREMKVFHLSKRHVLKSQPMTKKEKNFEKLRYYVLTFILTFSLNERQTKNFDE